MMNNEQKSQLTTPRVKHSASIGVALNITSKYYVSTAMWATSIMATGMKHPTYETFIWEWDTEKKERGKLIKQYYHSFRKTAILFHFRFCRTLAWRDLKEKMPNDHAYVDWND